VIYAWQQSALNAGAVAVYRCGGTAPDAATIALDSAVLLAGICLLVLAAQCQRGASTWLRRIRFSLAILTIACQAAGIAYRYTGLVFAPDASFALLLGAAWVVAPLQLMLVQVTLFSERRATAT